MELERQTIEKRDFPIGRRGYDPDAVDAHLEAIGREVERLRRSSESRSGASLASAASAQVQAIVEAAESSAADIERQAQMEAARIRQDAQREADAAREDAIQRAREHVSRVSEATATMLQRIAAMESELGALFESLRTGANRLNADLSLLEGNMGELYGAAGGTGRGEAPVAAEPALPPPPPPDLGAFDVGPSAEDDDARGAPADVDPPTATAPAGADDDVEGARLIALNMALNGQPREEAERYLAENFELDDRRGLLDEVYSAVEG